MSNQTKLSIVILNWNGADMMRRFLPSVLKHSAEAEVVVADNGSTDDSLAMLSREFPSVRQVVLDKNYGFAEGYNRGLKPIDAEYYLLLNSDVEVREGWLAPMLEYMDSHPEVAACQPKLLCQWSPKDFEYAGACGGYIDALGYPYCRGRVMGTIEEDKGQYNDIAPVLWATGACLLIRSKDYWEVGGLDGRFFAHQEEIDLCWRLRSRGRGVVCVPQSVAYHLGGGTLPQGNPRKTFLNFRNNLLLLYKNLPEERLAKVMRLRFWLDALASVQFLLTMQWGSFLAVWKARRAFYEMKEDFRKDREENLGKTTLSPVPEQSTFSLLWQYYIKGKKTYSKLCDRPISSHIKAISLLGLPIVVGQLGVIVQGMADTIMVGQYGTPELSASALVNNIYNFIIFFLLGISYATTPITGAAFGQGDDESVSRSLKDSLIVNLSFSAILVFLLTVLYFNLDILGQPEKLMPLVRPYYLIIMLSLPFLAGFNALKQFVEAVGETNIPMHVMLVSNAINIALNAILIYGMMGLPEWGLFGAGLATFIARVFLFVTMLVVVFRGNRFKVWTEKLKGENAKGKTDSLTSHRSNCPPETGGRAQSAEGVDNPLTPHRSSLSGSFRMARIGLPIAVQLCLESASFNIAGMFMGWIGDIPLAAHQVICTISTLVFMIQYGIGAAAAIRVSQFRGRGEWTEVRHATYSAWGLSATFSFLMVGGICLFREPITSIFTSDLRVQTLCYSLLPAFVLYQFGDCTQIIFSNSLRALEAVGRMLLYAIIAYLLVSIPMSYLLGIHLGFGAEGVWYGIPFGLTTAGLLFIYEFRRKTKHLT